MGYTTKKGSLWEGELVQQSNVRVKDAHLPEDRFKLNIYFVTKLQF